MIEGTQLYNKYAFNRKVHALHKKTPAPQKLGCIICDVDEFKNINDTRGHHVGDKVLQDLSRIFQATFDHKQAFIARTGGDEFAILLDVSSQGDFEHLLEICKPTSIA